MKLELLYGFLKKLYSDALDLFFPIDDHCLLCRKRCNDAPHYLCPACEAELEYLSKDERHFGFPFSKIKKFSQMRAFQLAPFEDFVCLYEYNDLAKKLLVAYKKQMRPALLHVISSLLIDAIDELIDISEIDAVTYVPSSRKKKSERGYDTIREVAKKIADNYGLPVIHTLQAREKPEQKHLTREERLKNIEKAFYLNDFKFSGKVPINLLLIDDIKTTGTTMMTCGRLLQGAGYRVYGLVAFSKK